MIPRRLVGILAFTGLGFGCVVLPASAATVGLDGRTVTVAAAVGETNNTRISSRPDGSVEVADTAGVTPATGCAAVSATIVVCGSNPAAPINALGINVGDLDDVVTNDTSLAAQIKGGSGRDALIGGFGPDVLIGETDVDVLDGRDGDDRIFIRGQFTDQAFCGLGQDFVDADFTDQVAADCEVVVRPALPPAPGGSPAEPAPPVGAPPGSSAQSGPPPTVVFPLARRDGCVKVIRGSTSADRLTGTSGGDTLLGLAGADILFGQLGDDCLFGGRGRDRLYGHGGADFLKGEQDADMLRGGSGADILSGDAGDDQMFGGPGPDMMAAGRGRDRLVGGSENDVLSGGLDSDILDGGDGDDRLGGGPGNDSLSVGRGRNTAFGGGGRDRIDARNAATDRIECGAGRDFVRADRRDRVASDCERVVRTPPRRTSRSRSS